MARTIKRRCRSAVSTRPFAATRWKASAVRKGYRWQLPRLYGPQWTRQGRHRSVLSSVRKASAREGRGTWGAVDCCRAPRIQHLKLRGEAIGSFINLSAIMKARDVMTFPVITAKPSDTVQEVARVLLENRISAVPVVGDADRILGIVSEGDLLHRMEAGTERRRSWWLLPFLGEQTFAADYVKAHAKKVSDVMTRNVITASPETPLHEIAALLEKHAIKRVPIAIGGRLRGIVSRANLIQAVASAGKALNASSSDAEIREKLLLHLQQQPWA